MNKNALSTSLVCFLLCLIMTPAMAQGKDPQVDTARIMAALRSGNDFGHNHFNYISWQDNLMMTSPDAAKMTRYADTPISYAYGQAQIGILFERARNGLDDRHGFNVVYYGLGKIH